MGTCMSLQGNASFLKRTKHLKPIVKESPNTSHTSATLTSRFSRPGTVLKDLPGDDIFSRYRFGENLEQRTNVSITKRGKPWLARLSKSKLRTEIGIEDVRREVGIMRHLPAHPNIVRYKAVYEDREAVYLVMELCEGGELFDRIVARGHYTERAAALVTKTIVEVVKVTILRILSH
ncbi:hypothetical protein RJ639_026106 [Escallonia herrerae]|uniref:Protein kinase domain-containing protein n=1 Tax=Escallonia herrerae TaxID=1293975 RepID=A0AA89AC31_9ASTE|nr:hypothetical protein RJ639_026106 [Escallonia herrerae]